MQNFLSSEKHNHQNKFEEQLLGTDWLGIIVDSKDELFMGRCKIRVFEKYDTLADDELPWAFPIHSNVFSKSTEDGGYGSFSYPKVGTLVRVHFQNGDIYSPEYTAIQNINEKMQTEISSSYVNCQVVTYDEDEDMKIIYTQDGGLLMWHKESYMRIDKTKHITINHSGGTSIQTFIDGNVTITTAATIIEKSPMIHLDSPDTRLGPGSFQSATRCESLMDLLMNLAKMIDEKIPKTGTLAQNLVKANKTLICSSTVDIAK
jgi:hypothetical protein